MVGQTFNEATELVSETMTSVSGHAIPFHVLVGKFSVGTPVARSVASSRAKTLLTSYDERSVVVTTQLAQHCWPYVGPMWVYWLALHCVSKVGLMELWPAGHRWPAFVGPIYQYVGRADDVCLHRAYIGFLFWANICLLSSDQHWNFILAQYYLPSSDLY